MKYLALILLLSSCSVIKKVTQKKEKDKTEIHTQAEEKKEAKTELERKTLTTIEADTTQMVRGSELTGEHKGVTPWTLEDTNQVVTISIDSARGTVSVKARVKDRQIATKFKKTVAEDLKQTKTEKSDSTGKRDEKVKIVTSEKDKDVKRTGMPWWLWLLILPAIAVGCWRLYNKVFRKV